MCVHNPAAVEVGLEKVNDTQLRACRDVHQGLFVLDLCIPSMLALFQAPCLVKLLM